MRNAGREPYQIVAVPGNRELQAELVPMVSLADLAYQMTRRANSPLAIRKSLVFCNTRNEVEQTEILPQP